MYKKLLLAVCFVVYPLICGATTYNPPGTGGSGSGDGTGDVVGPASATSGNFPIYSGATGKLLSDSIYGPTSFAAAFGADDNYVTDAEKTKITGIETGADVTDSTNVETAGAVMDSELNAGTDVTADLEEEAHASEHAIGGADSVFGADPGADAIWLWDYSESVYVHALIGAGFAFDGTTLSATASATALDDIGDADSTASVNIGAGYTFTFILDTGSGVRFQDAEGNYFDVSTDGSDLVWSMHDEGDDGDIYTQYENIVVGDDGAITFTGTGDIDLPDDSVDSADIATDAVGMDAIDADGDFTTLSGNWATSGVLAGCARENAVGDGSEIPASHLNGVVNLPTGGGSVYMPDVQSPGGGFYFVTFRNIDGAENDIYPYAGKKWVLKDQSVLGDGSGLEPANEAGGLTVARINADGDVDVFSEDATSAETD